MQLSTIRTTVRRVVGVMVFAASVAGLAGGAAAADVTGERVAVPRTRILAPIDDNDRVTLSGHRSPRALRAQEQGPVPDGQRVERMILSLSPDAAQREALDRFVQASHDRGSAQYGQWLTPQAFEHQFGVSDADLTQITDWLKGHGFTVDQIPAGRRSIVFSGTVGQIRSAFHTQIRHYLEGREPHFANDADPQIPDALAPLIQGIVSLHDFHSRRMTSHAVPYYSSGTTHAISPADFKTIYNLKTTAAQGIDGTGATIAVLGRTNILTADISTFQTQMGLPVKLPTIVLNGTNPGRIAGDEGESDLDLEWAGAVAPGATIKFVTSASTTTTDGIDLSAQYAVSNNVADIITLSYGLCEADLLTSGMAFYNTLWQQAVAQGISVFVSSGDSGAAGCESGSTATSIRGQAVNGLCSSTFSTCVGGTQFDDTASPATYWSSTTHAADQSSALSYIPEIVWNESGTVSGGSGLWSTGGGASAVYTKPSWQSAPGVPADGRRDVPDVSLTAASHDGYLVSTSDTPTGARGLYIFGGTSASTPSFAGLMALIRQKTGARQGNANPRFYQLATQQVAGGTAVFHQITAGNNSVPGQTGFSASTATPAFNLATGLGSVDSGQLVANWAAVLSVSTTGLTATPTATVVGQNVALSATVAGVAPTGTVQFQDGAANLGSAVTLSGSTAALNTTSLGVGNHTLTALYSGDGANQPSVSSPVTVSISPVTSSVALASSSALSTLGQSVTFSATLTAQSPSGTVQFFDGATLLGTVAVSGCTVSFSTAGLALGTHSMTAVYSGNANNTASTSPVVVQQVNAVLAASSTSLLVSPSALAYGQTTALTATVSGKGPTGTVQFKDGTANLGSPLALVNGMATSSTASLGVGNHTLTAAYAGDTQNAASQSAGVAVSVSPAAASVGLSSSLASVPAGQTVTFTVVITGASPTGSVQFFDGNTSLGTVTLTAGSATLSTSSLSAGAHTITASYSGDANYMAATSAGLSVTVTAGSGDVPTLPTWAGLLLGSTLLAMIRGRSRAVSRSATRGPGAQSWVWVGLMLLAGWPVTSMAAVLAGWDVHALPGGTNAFGTSPLAASSADANLTVGGLTRGSGVGTTGAGAGRGWGGTTWTAASAAAAAISGEFISWTMAAKTGYRLSITSISRFDYRRSSSGATSGVLQYQVGSGLFIDAATLAYPSTANGGASIAAIDLSAVSALQNVPSSTTVTFRVLNYGAIGATGTWYAFDQANSTANDLEVSGSVVATSPVNGACGASNGQTFALAPNTNLCSAGTGSAVAGTGPWSWSCAGLNGGTSASCTANTSVVGTCP
jgi:hypothetical protein